MKRFFIEGGPLFMGILTVLFFVILALAVFYFILILRKDYKNLEELRKKLTYLKVIGVFTLVTGFLAQMVGMFTAFEVISRSPDISPAIIAGGLKVSMICPIYGILIMLISYALWIALDYLASRNID